MADDINDEKPRLIDTGRGFSIFYRGVYLYSQYNPKKNIIQRIDSVQIPESALVLCFSPILDYGLQQLIDKAPQNSFVLGLEYDQMLMRISIDTYDSALLNSNRFAYVRTNTIAELLKKIEHLPSYPFKHCITLTCSAAVQLHQEFYLNVKRSVDEHLARFWMNRLTLIQLGRNYQHNIFRNLSTFLETDKCYFLHGTEKIQKPILVAGAGPSLDSARSFIIQNRRYFFLLAVDAAAAALLPEIQPDAIVLVESQYWIDSAFIGLVKSGIPLFADLTSSAHVIRSLRTPIYFFCTEYTKSSCLQDMYDRFQVLKLEPMGSVGLTAVQLALQLGDAPAPIFYTGLDFSWGKGLTHARSSSPVKKLYSSLQRTYSCYALNFPFQVQSFIGKNNAPAWATANLISYAQLYQHAFAHNERLIDIRTEGIPLTSYCTSYDEAAHTIMHTPHASFELHFSDAALQKREKELILSYLTSEFTLLTALVNHLEGTHPMPQQDFTHILQHKDYLYNHFPDAERGYRPELHFLKRIRIEITAILKIISRLF
ncbi:MAG: 6-hydroxymethylpterin diphosphokinase MptE-like protein [Treponema sp.]